MKNKSLSVDFNEKNRILSLHKILNEQQNNPVIVDYKNYIDLARKIIDNNYCDFSNFNGWSNSSESILDKPTPYKLKTGKVGILAKAKTDDPKKTYKAGQFLFFYLDNIQEGNLIYVVGGDTTKQTFQYYCKSLEVLIDGEITKIISAVNNLGFKAPNQFTDDERLLLTNPNLYKKQDIVELIKTNYPQFNPLFYNTLSNRYQTFYKSIVSPGTKALTEPQKQVIATYEKKGYLTNINPAEAANYTKFDLSKHENVFSEPFYMYGKNTTAKDISKGYGDNTEILQNIDDPHRQCLKVLDQFENLLATYRNKSDGLEPIKKITEKIQYCFYKYSDKKFGQRLESLDVIGDYANVPDVFKIKRY